MRYFSVWCNAPRVHDALLVPDLRVVSSDHFTNQLVLVSALLVGAGGVDTHGIPGVQAPVSDTAATWTPSAAWQAL